MTLPAGLGLETLALGLVFIAVVLAVEAGVTAWQDARRSQQRLNRHLALTAGGTSTEDILLTLRRTSVDLSNARWPSALAYLESRLTQAGLTISAQRMLLMMVGATLGIGLVFPVLGGVVGAVRSVGAVLLLVFFAASLGVVAPLLYLNFVAARRIKALEAQFPVALDILVRGLRAGYPVATALDLVVKELADPLASELGLVVSEMNYGYPLQDALANFAQRVQTPDVNMFVVSVSIQMETGGSLAEILDNLTKVIRDRAAMVLKVRALASEGKMTGIMLSGLPLFTFVSVFSRSPNFYLDVVDDPLFLPAALGIAVLYVLGIVIMRRIIAIKV